jgi:hypothetical protein
VYTLKSPYRTSVTLGVGIGLSSANRDAEKRRIQPLFLPTKGSPSFYVNVKRTRSLSGVNNLIYIFAKGKNIDITGKHVKAQRDDEIFHWSGSRGLRVNIYLF